MLLHEEVLMKKRTVIETEKSEVWVIRPPSDDGQEQASDGGEKAASSESLIAPLDESLGEDFLEGKQE